MNWNPCFARSFPPAIHVSNTREYIHSQLGQVRPKVHRTVCEAGVRTTNNFVDIDGFALDLWSRFIGSDAEIAIGVSDEGRYKVLWRQKISHNTLKVFQFPADNSMASIADHGSFLVHTLAYGAALAHKHPELCFHGLDWQNTIADNGPIRSGNTIFHSHKNVDTKEFMRRLISLRILRILLSFFSLRCSVDSQRFPVLWLHRYSGESKGAF